MKGSAELDIRRAEESDRSWMRAEMVRWWGAESIVIKNTRYHPAEMDGFVASIRGERIGLVTLRFEGNLCEIMSLTTSEKHPASGRRLLSASVAHAKKNGAERMTVVTTNDNLRALRFYQKAGFRLNTLCVGSVDKSRKIKPEIPLLGMDGIPIRDEIELEMTI